LRKQIADSLLDIGHHPGRVSGSLEGIGKGLPQGGPFSFFGISSIWGLAIIHKRFPSAMFSSNYEFLCV
jgi:hypothetical protein